MNLLLLTLALLLYQNPNPDTQVSLVEELGNVEEGELNSSAEARRLAFYLFWNIKPYFDRNYIIPEDLEHFLSARKAAQAFTLLDVDGDGKARGLLCSLCCEMARQDTTPILHAGLLLCWQVNAHHVIWRQSALPGSAAHDVMLQRPETHLTPCAACCQVSLHDIRDAVINIYRERKFLAATLRDTRTVVSRLELVIGVVVHLVFVFFYLLIFRVRIVC